MHINKQLNESVKKFENLIECKVPSDQK